MHVRRISLWAITMLLGLAGALCGDTFKAGDIFYGTNQGDTVEWYRSNGTKVADLSASGVVADFLAFDASGQLYVSQEGTVGKFDTHGDFLGTFATTAGGERGGLVFNKAGDLFAGTTNGNLSAGSGIFEFNTSGSLIHTYLPGTVVDGVALESNQNVLLFTDESDTVHSLNLTTNHETAFATTAGGADAGLTILPNGDVLVAGFTSNEVYLLDSHGNLIKTYSAADPVDVVLDPSGSSFWVSNYFQSTVEEINLSTGGVEDTIGGSGARAAGLAIFTVSSVSTPEPASAGLLLAGLAASILLARRRAAN